MLVEYDNSPVRYLEPRPPSDYILDGSTPGSVRMLAPGTDRGRIGGWEITDGTYYNNVHKF